MYTHAATLNPFMITVQELSIKPGDPEWPRNTLGQSPISDHMFLILCFPMESKSKKCILARDTDRRKKERVSKDQRHLPIASRFKEDLAGSRIENSTFFQKVFFNSITFTLVNNLTGKNFAELFRIFLSQ